MTSTVGQDEMVHRPSGEVSTLPHEVVKEVMAFHGHMCPGLAIGIRAAEVALRDIGAHAQDEEVVTIVETDMCAVDAIQYLTGCTFGKGNLIHLDHGKNAYTFIRRSDGKAIRVLTRPDAFGDEDAERSRLFARVREGTASPEEQARFQELHLRKSEEVLRMPEEQLFEVSPVPPSVPARARLHQSLLCEECGEATMEPRTRRFGGRTLCIPCFQRHEARI